MSFPRRLGVGGHFQEDRDQHQNHVVQSPHSDTTSIQATQDVQSPDSSSNSSDQMLQDDSVCSIVFQSSDPQPEEFADVIDQGQVQRGQVQQAVRQEDMELHGIQEDQYQKIQKLLRVFPEHHDRETQVRALQVVQDLLQACQPQDLSETDCHSPVQDNQVLSGHCGDEEDKSQHDCCRDHHHSDHLPDQHQHPTISSTSWFPQDDELLDCHHQVCSGKGFGGKPLRINLVDKSLQVPQESSSSSSSRPPTSYSTPSRTLPSSLAVCGAINTISFAAGQSISARHCQDHGAIHRASVRQLSQRQGVQSQQSYHFQALRRVHSDNRLQNPFHQRQVISASNLQGSFLSGQIPAGHVAPQSHKVLAHSLALRQENLNKTVKIVQQNLHSCQVFRGQLPTGQCQLPSQHQSFIENITQMVLFKFGSRRRMCTPTSSASRTFTTSLTTSNSTSSRTLTSTLSFRLDPSVSTLKSQLLTWTQCRSSAALRSRGAISQSATSIPTSLAQSTSCKQTSNTNQNTKVLGTSSQIPTSRYQRLTSTPSSTRCSGLTSSSFHPVPRRLHGQDHRDSNGHQSITITSTSHQHQGFKVSSFRVLFENLPSSLSIITSVVTNFALRLIESWSSPLHQQQSCCHTQRQEESARLTKSLASSVCINGSNSLRSSWITSSTSTSQVTRFQGVMKTEEKVNSQNFRRRIRHPNRRDQGIIVMHNRTEIIGKHLKSQMVQDQFTHIMFNQIDYGIVTQEGAVKKIKVSNSIPHVAPMGSQEIVKNIAFEKSIPLVVLRQFREECSRKQEIVKKDIKKGNGQNNSDKRVHYNDLIDNKVIDKWFGQEIRFTFSVTAFDVKKSKTIGSSDATAASIELNGFKFVSATSEGQTHDSPVQKTWSETQSAELRVSNSVSQTQSAQGNLSEIKTEKFITEVHLKQLHAEKCRTATSSSISHSASDASRRVPQALRVRGSNLRRSDLSSLESKNSGEENQKSRRQSVRASAVQTSAVNTSESKTQGQRVQRSTFSTTTSKCWSHSSAAQRQQLQNYNLNRSQSQSQSARLPAQQLRVKESQPQTQRLKLHDLNDKHFQSSTQTGQSETQAGELRELKRATSDSEAQRQEVKEPQQELTRSTTETHRVKAKESRSSTTETQGVKAKRERVKLHFAET